MKCHWKIIWLLCMNYRSPDFLQFLGMYIIAGVRWKTVIAKLLVHSPLATFSFGSSCRRMNFTCSRRKNAVTSFRRHVYQAKRCLIITQPLQAAQRWRMLAITFDQHPHELLDAGKWKVFQLFPPLRMHEKTVLVVWMDHRRCTMREPGIRSLTRRRYRQTPLWFQVLQVML